MAKKKESVKGIGRWAPIGMTAATSAWKNVNPNDEHLIFLLDTATGEITVCGDASGVRAGIGGRSGRSLVTPARKRTKLPKSAESS